ncbi:uncharacterized protein LOC143028891 [Oratosquilla oratoria]|uniref:uncharacterized protein LOC143028891 n=1 Tax=Oratosquilla oratoria TaxID=337810 RepID=UPI003F767BA8
MKKEISSYISRCHRCQVAGKPHPSVKPFPLQSIPVIEEPFGRIVIGCVGPLPKTPRGNKFLFAMIDCATRYPEAIPLRRITAKNVVRALIYFYTQVGLPTVVQSDQGSNFTSRLFNQVMQTLGVQQSRSSAYHPQSQGVVERFHQTFKRILRAYCLEFRRDWDIEVDPFLFTVRDSVQESLRFSPFQLIYGHEVRGPLKALKESWLLENSVTPLIPYVAKFEKRIKTAVRLGHAHSKSAQINMKQQFDKTNQTHLFQAKYDGPFQIVVRVGEANYVVYTPDRRKKKRIVHVNLLKPYRMRKKKEREASVEPPLPTCVVVSACDIDQEDSFSELQSGLYIKVDNSTILSDPSVNCRARHRNQRISAHPPTSLPPERIQEGIRPWASPVVLVPKTDGSMRPCIDYRKFNAVTDPDSPLPRIDVIDDIGRAQWVTKLDLLQGNYQVRLSERSRTISAFITPEALHQLTVLPFGLRNAPATFHEHPAHRLTVNLAKSEFGHTRITHLGHVVGRGEVQPIAAKITAILQYPAPSDKKGRPFIIHVNVGEVGAGAVLLQEGEEDRVLHPVCYFSKKLLKSQRNYTTIENEALALIMVLGAFRVYVGSTVHPDICGINEKYQPAPSAHIVTLPFSLNLESMIGGRIAPPIKIGH